MTHALAILAGLLDRLEPFACCNVKVVMSAVTVTRSSRVIKHAGDGQHAEGRTEAVKLSDTPPAVLQAAIAAARLIGDGFYLSLIHI